MAKYLVTGGGGFIGSRRQGGASRDGAESTMSRAGVAEDEERGGSGGVALAAVRTGGSIADGDQPVCVQQLAHRSRLPRMRQPSLQPRGKSLFHCDASRCRSSIAFVIAGSTSSRSPMMPSSLTRKIWASGSVLIAMMCSAVCIPARC